VTAPLRLYSYWRSSCSWRVRIALNLKGVEYEYRPIHLTREGGAQNTAEYQEKNPLRTVPLLEWEEGGELLRLSQSMAILCFLEDRYPSPPLWPKDPLRKARAWMLAEIPNSGIQPLQNLAVIQKVKRELGGDGDAWAGHWNERGLQALESWARPLAGKYLMGDEVSVADVCLVPQLYGARRFGVDLSPFPTLTRVEQACEALDAFARARPERQPDAEK
jgi:maleylpyruvate isomerase